MSIQTTIVLVPGLNNAGPAHWQTLLQNKFVNIVRVKQDDWDNPSRKPWIAGIEQIVKTIDGPIVFVGHSCGSVAIAQWAEQFGGCYSNIKGALLVAPADVDRENAHIDILAMRPLPKAAINFKSIIICSDNDDHCTLDKSYLLARQWNSEVVLVKGGSHFHTEAGYGKWPLVEQLMAELAGQPLIIKKL